MNGDGYADLIIGGKQAVSGKGRAYIYHGSTNGVSAVSTTLTGSVASSNFGMSVGGAGDVNGDGYGDVIVGAHAVSNFTGEAYVYLGSASGLATTVGSTLTGRDGAGGVFGYSVAGAGDVTGDGYADVIVGSSGNGTGAAYVYAGSATGTSTSPAKSYVGPTGDVLFGKSVAHAGEVNRGWSPGRCRA